MSAFERIYIDKENNTMGNNWGLVKLFESVNGVTVKGTLTENEYIVYHGTNNEFSRFSLDKAVQGIIWFTDSIDSIKNNEHGGQGSKYIMKRKITINNPAGWDEYEKYGIGQLKGLGYDGVILSSGDYNNYIVFNSKQIRV